MKKSIFTFLLVCVICIANLIPAEAAGAQNITIYINGNIFDTSVPVESINSVTYVPIREFSKALANTDCSWDDSSQTAYFNNSSVSISIGVGAQYLTVNGRYFYLPDGSRMIDNKLMVPLREIAKACGAAVEWNPDNQTIYVYSGSGAVQSGDSFYDQDSVYWLSRLIYSESGGEPLTGQIGVGNVVLNRVNSGKYADTIYGVIFQPNQFSVVNSGAIYRNPSEKSVIAAKICLEGYNVAGSSLYFCNPNLEESRWFKSALTLYTVIGNHAFYV